MMYDFSPGVTLLLFMAAYSRWGQIVYHLYYYYY